MHFNSEFSGEDGPYAYLRKASPLSSDFSGNVRFFIVINTSFLLFLANKVFTNFTFKKH